MRKIDANDALHYETEGSVKSAVELQTNKWTISAPHPLVQRATAMMNANLLRLSRQLESAHCRGLTFFSKVRKNGCSHFIDTS